MAITMKREQDIVKNSIDAFRQATEKDYAQRLGAPDFVTYYQADEISSRMDFNLEGVHSLIGPNSPIKYNRIRDVAVYKLTGMDSVSTERVEYGTETTLQGEFILLPETIKPNADDFFQFTYEGQPHLYRITDVQFDKVTTNKYYKVTFKLYELEASTILSNLNQDYRMEYSNIGTGYNTILKEEAVIIAGKAEKLVDKLIDDYVNDYYDQNMDMFTYRSDDGNFWSPYLQKFLYNTKALSKYKQEILQEFYFMDMNQFDYKEVYSERAYRKFLYHAVETQNSFITKDMSYMKLDSFPLAERRNLPFHHAKEEYQLLALSDKGCKCGFFTLSSYPYMFVEPSKLSDVPSTHVSTNGFDDIGDAPQAGDIIYSTDEDRTNIYDIVYIDDNMNALYASADEVLNPDSATWTGYTENNLILSTIGLYLNESFELSTEFLTALNREYFDANGTNYLLIPILIYIIKDCISKAQEK